MNSSIPLNVSSSERQGWTAGASNRGTIDIIWNSCATLFLCCWSILVTNVPTPGSSTWRTLQRKLLLVALYAVAPELIFQAAMGQYLSARRSVSLFHNSGHKDWTIRHGFYVNMGGIHLKPNKWQSFPINASQLLYLVEHGYVEYPKIGSLDIRDKNKVDGTLRIITLIQTLWFVSNIIGRAAQGLTITVLELSTAAFVWIGAATTLFWLYKPADIRQPDIVETKASIEEILRDGGDRARAHGIYYYTPLDFVGREEWSWSILWSHGINYLRSLHLTAFLAERPLCRFHNTVVPAIETKYYPIFILISTCYFATFLTAWNFSFPTLVENRLWRAASLISLVTALMECAIIQISFGLWNAQKARKSSLESSKQTKSPESIVDNVHVRRDGRKNDKTWITKVWEGCKNNSLTKDPALDTPPFLVCITWFLGIFYCSARAYIIIYDFVELRSLQSSAYREVNWSVYWPHF